MTKNSWKPLTRPGYRLKRCERWKRHGTPETPGSPTTNEKWNRPKRTQKPLGRTETKPKRPSEPEKGNGRALMGKQAGGHPRTRPSKGYPQKNKRSTHSTETTAGGVAEAATKPSNASPSTPQKELHYRLRLGRYQPWLKEKGKGRRNQRNREKSHRPNNRR